MDNSPDSLPNVSCFDLFVKDPKGSKAEVIQGAHKFMTHVIKGSEQSPKNSVFIGLFNQITKVPIKSYVFMRMTKSILQELALCVLQELILYGPSRAQNLSLVLEETRTGGKTVVIEKDEFPVDKEFISDIDEAFFRLSDVTGFSPDKKVASGQGREAPYAPPNPEGFFTPIKPKPKSLHRDFQVRTGLILEFTFPIDPARFPRGFCHVLTNSYALFSRVWKRRQQDLTDRLARPGLLATRFAMEISK